MNTDYTVQSYSTGWKSPVYSITLDEFEKLPETFNPHYFRFAKHCFSQ